MSDNPKEAKKNMAKAIFISADCWLCVFDLLPASQLGFGIALISHRFDHYVDEHFKTRKRTLKFIQIRSKIGKNGTKKMEIVNYYSKPLPIPQIQLPHKIIGFNRIEICFIDRNVINFLRRFRQLFASFCPINLSIRMKIDDHRISEFLLRNIWPLLGKNIHSLDLSATFFRHLRKFAPSILNDCPSLRYVFFNFEKLFTGFPCRNNAMASDGQAVAKWLFTPLQNGVPKVFKCGLDTHDGNWSSNIEAIKAAFASASSPVNFISVFWFPLPFADSVVPFDLTNELTREQLALKGTNCNNCFLLIRCPIARDASKWTKWEKEAIGWEIDNQWNRIHFLINDEYHHIGDGLLNAMPGPSDQQQK